MSIRFCFLRQAACIAVHFFRIVVGLQVHPELFARPEIAGETCGSVCTHGTLAEHDLADSKWWYANLASQSVLAEFHRFQRLFAQDIARVNVGKLK